MRVAVVGATGLIGRRVAAALVARGDSAVAVSRSGSAGVEGAEDVRWDPAEGPPPAEALDGVDAVVNLAGTPIGAKRWSDARKRMIRESRTLTTRALAEALAQPDRPGVLVSASGIDFYGPREEEVDESSGPGFGFLAETAVAWEREAMRAAAHGARVVVVRSGLVLARGADALVRMARPVRLFAGGPLGGGRQWFSWIHIDDEVGMILLALDEPEISGPLNAVAPEPARQRDFVAALGRALHRPASLPTPALAVRLAVGEMATLALDGRPVRPRAALDAGYRFLHPDLDEALRDALKR